MGVRRVMGGGELGVGVVGGFLGVAALYRNIEGAVGWRKIKVTWGGTSVRRERETGSTGHFGHSS